VLNLLYFYTSTFRSMCAVPNMALWLLLWWWWRRAHQQTEPSCTSMWEPLNVAARHHEGRASPPLPSQSWMFNKQIYCHTLPYHSPTANRTLHQWRLQLVTSKTQTDLLKQKTNVCHTKIITEIKPRTTRGAWHAAVTGRRKMRIKFLSGKLKGRALFGTQQNNSEMKAK
jgi:hypothetical protein